MCTLFLKCDMYLYMVIALVVFFNKYLTIVNTSLGGGYEAPASNVPWSQHPFMYVISCLFCHNAEEACVRRNASIVVRPRGK